MLADERSQAAQHAVLQGTAAERRNMRWHVEDGDSVLSSAQHAVNQYGSAKPSIDEVLGQTLARYRQRKGGLFGAGVEVQVHWSPSRSKGDIELNLQLNARPGVGVARGDEARLSVPISGDALAQLAQSDPAAKQALEGARTAVLDRYRTYLATLPRVTAASPKAS